MLAGVGSTSSSHEPHGFVGLEVLALLMNLMAFSDPGPLFFFGALRGAPLRTLVYAPIRRPRLPPTRRGPGSTLIFQPTRKHSSPSPACELAELSLLAHLVLTLPRSTMLSFVSVLASLQTMVDSAAGGH